MKDKRIGLPLCRWCGRKVHYRTRECEACDAHYEVFRDLHYKIMRKELSICETCDTFFKYIPQKRFCDECRSKRTKSSREYCEKKLMLGRKGIMMRDYNE